MPRTATELPELLEFLRPRHRALLGTHRRDGRLALSPVACGIAADGRLVVSTYPQPATTANARRDPRATVVVLSDDWDGRGCRSKGL